MLDISNLLRYIKSLVWWNISYKIKHVENQLFELCSEEARNKNSK